MITAEDLGLRQLIVVTGKGGVGKTAVAAALAVRLAGPGRRVLLLEVDPRESAHQMLGVAPTGGEMVPAGEGLALQNLQPLRVVDELVGRQVRFGWLADRVRRSTIYHHFVEGAPGLKELALLGHAYLLARGEAAGTARFDTVIIDAPATGHGVSLLAAPQVVSEVIRGGPLARMTGDVAAWLADPALTAVVVVTLAEEMPVTEALELRATLASRLSRAPELLVVNGLYPPYLGARPRADDLPGHLWRDRREVNERETARLAAAWPGDRVELPLLPLPRGPALIAALAARLDPVGARSTA